MLHQPLGYPQEGGLATLNNNVFVNVFHKAKNLCSKNSGSKNSCTEGRGHKGTGRQACVVRGRRVQKCPREWARSPCSARPAPYSTLVCTRLKYTFSACSPLNQGLFIYFTRARTLAQKSICVIALKITVENYGSRSLQTAKVGTDRRRKPK